MLYKEIAFLGSAPAKWHGTAHYAQNVTVRYNETFHDRFLIIDDKELYLIGASLKDLGSKCFAFTKLDPTAIRGIKKSAFHPEANR